MQKLLTAQDLAAASGLALQTIYNRHASGGSLPRCIKLGNRLRFHPDDVRIWLADCYEVEVRTAPACDSKANPMAHPGRPTKREQVARRSSKICSTRP